MSMPTARPETTSTSSPGDRAVTEPAPETPTEIEAHGWREILRRSLQQFKHDAITDRAAALTYFGVLAIFPGLIVVVSILGLLGRSTTNRFLTNVESLAPGSVKSFLTTAIEQTQNRPGTAGAATAIGVVVAVWSASGYIAAFMRATNQIYSVDEGQPIWKTAPIRLAVTIAIIVMLIVTVLMVVVTGSIVSEVGQALGIGHTAVVVWDIAKWPVRSSLACCFLAILGLPERETTRLSLVHPRRCARRRHLAARVRRFGFYVHSPAPTTRPTARWRRSSSSWCGYGSPTLPFCSAPNSTPKSNTSGRSMLAFRSRSNRSSRP